MSSIGAGHKEVHDQRYTVAIAIAKLAPGKPDPHQLTCIQTDQMHFQGVRIVSILCQNVVREYISNQSQQLQLFRKMEKARNTKDGSASPRRHSKNKSYTCHIRLTGAHACGHGLKLKAYGVFRS